MYSVPYSMHAMSGILLKTVTAIMLGLALTVPSQAQDEQAPWPGPATQDWDTARVWTDFEAALQRPEQVLRLDLTKNKWKEVDFRLRRFRQLRELVLDRNKLDTLP